MKIRGAIILPCCPLCLKDFLHQRGHWILRCTGPYGSVHLFYLLRKKNKGIFDYIQVEEISKLMKIRHLHMLQKLVKAENLV